MNRGQSGRDQHPEGPERDRNEDDLLDWNAVRPEHVRSPGQRNSGPPRDLRKKEETEIAFGGGQTHGGKATRTAAPLYDARSTQRVAPTAAPHGSPVMPHSLVAKKRSDASGLRGSIGEVRPSVVVDEALHDFPLLVRGCASATATFVVSSAERRQASFERDRSLAHAHQLRDDVGVLGLCVRGPNRVFVDELAADPLVLG